MAIVAEFSGTCAFEELVLSEVEGVGMMRSVDAKGVRASQGNKIRGNKIRE